MTKIPIIIVAYGNPGDVAACLNALAASNPEPRFDVFICENRGTSAFDRLTETLMGKHLIGEATDLISRYESEGRFSRIHSFGLRGTDAKIAIGEAIENLGYAGGINAWLEILLLRPWPGVWILNPDTEPAPNALAELVAWARERRIGMVGSHILNARQPKFIHSRGLHWRRIHSSTKAVDYGARADLQPNPDKIERAIDAPSGAAVYVTRACLDKIGVMDERFFLYFEDLDWGYRAKRSCGVGYAVKSIVAHRVGSAIGTPRGDKAGSMLATYLDFRNSIHFVRKHHPAWLPWAFIALAIRSFEYGVRGKFEHMRTGFKGLFAGLSREFGRPDHIMNQGASLTRTQSANIRQVAPDNSESN